MSDYGHVSLVKVWPEHCEQPWTCPSLLKYRRVEVHGTVRFEEEQTGAVVADVKAYEDWLREMRAYAWEQGFDEGRDDLGAAVLAQEHGEVTNPHRA